MIADLEGAEEEMVVGLDLTDGIEMARFTTFVKKISGNRVWSLN